MKTFLGLPLAALCLVGSLAGGGPANHDDQVVVARGRETNGIIIANGRELNGVIIVNGRGLAGSGLTLDGVRVENGRLVR